MNVSNDKESNDEIKSSRKNAFIDVYNRNNEIEQHPEIYNPKTPIKDVTIMVVAFIVSLLFPVLGLILYGIWKDDQPRLAKSSLIGFSLNALFAAYTIISIFLFY